MAERPPGLSDASQQAPLPINAEEAENRVDQLKIEIKSTLNNIRDERLDALAKESQKQMKEQDEKRHEMSKVLSAYTKRIEELIIKAISTSKYRWRTPRGIAKDSGVPDPQVIEILEGSELFIRARKDNDRGEPLYTTKEKYKSDSTLGQRLLAAITNKVHE